MADPLMSEVSFISKKDNLVLLLQVEKLSLLQAEERIRVLVPVSNRGSVGNPDN